MTPLPFTLEQYQEQLRRMMTTPVPIMGQPPQQGMGMIDKLRAAATSLKASTALAGSTLG